MDFEIDFKVKYDIRNYNIIFIGGYYSVTFTKYTDSIIIQEMVYICDNLERKKKEPTFENRRLRTYDLEYKQIYSLLKKEELKKEVLIK